MRFILLCCLFVIGRATLTAADAPLDLELETAIARGTEVAAGVSGGDGDALEHFLDYDALMERALRGLPMTAKERADYGRGFRNAANLGKQIVTQTSKSGSYTLLTLVLGFSLLAILIFMAVTRRYVGRLTSLATLVATAMLLLWLIDSGLLPGTEGPLSTFRPRTLLDKP